jgi:hypothetical protein
LNQVAKYSTERTNEVAEFLDNVGAAKASGGNTESILDGIQNESGFKAPAALQDVLGKVAGKDQSRILDAVTKGIDSFTAQHGTAPTADVVEAALQQGRVAYDMIGPDGRPMLDAIANSASSSHSDPMSLQPNRAVVAILTAIAEAIPFASYLPVDIASNQAKLAILQHEAGSLYGDYVVGGLMDGTSAGNVYASSSRMGKIDITGTAPFTTKFTQTNLVADPGYCDAAGPGVPVLRGRTIVYVNGKVAAVDSAQGSGATAPVSGTVRLGTTDYAIVGSVTIATGAVSLTSITPTLPVGTEVVAQGFVDYEVAPALIPSVLVRANTYDLYANPWRVMTSLSIDSSTQLRNELGLDGSSEALMAIRSQMALERHYLALRMAASLAKNNVNTFDFAWNSRSAQMNRSQIWQDLQANLAVVDQKMANDTMDHGVTHIYVGSWLAGIMQSLPADMFVSSGIVARPSIYRLGRLFGKYEAYYSPKVATQATDLTTAKIIAIGRSSQVARCPVVLGDAVSPTFLDLNMQSDLKRNAAMYARDFTVVNPHEPSALGCAEINLTNLA